MRCFLFSIIMFVSVLSEATPPSDIEMPIKKCKLEAHMQLLEEEFFESLNKTLDKHENMIQEVFNDSGIDHSIAEKLPISQLANMASILHWNDYTLDAKELLEFIIKRPQLIATATNRELNLLSPIVEHWRIYKGAIMFKDEEISLMNEDKALSPEVKFDMETELSLMVRDQANPIEGELWAYQEIQFKIMGNRLMRKLTFGSQSLECTTSRIDSINTIYQK